MKVIPVRFSAKTNRDSMVDLHESDFTDADTVSIARYGIELILLDLVFISITLFGFLWLILIAILIFIADIDHSFLVHDHCSCLQFS